MQDGTQAQDQWQGCLQCSACRVCLWQWVQPVFFQSFHQPKKVKKHDSKIPQKAP